jgi:hypothetical protein
LAAPGYENIKEKFEGCIPFDKKINIPQNGPGQEEINKDHLEMIIN